VLKIVLIIMSTATKERIETVDFQGFKYGVFERPAGRMNLSLYADIGSGELAHVLATRSSPLADKVAFYVIGRDLALGLEQAEALPEPVKRIGRAVYEDCQKRRKEDDWQVTWHKDAVLIEPEAIIPGNPRPGKDYVASRYFQNITGFNKDQTDVVTTPETVEERLWLPLGGDRYMLPTVGPNKRYGLPDATTNSFDKTVKALVNADLGLTKETAKAEISKFFRGNSGLFAVWSGSDPDGGALCVDLSDGPRGGNGRFGSFPLSRLASGASHDPKNSKLRLVTEEEYKAFEADRKALDAVKRVVNK